MCDYIKPELRHQPDIIILNCGTNDNSNEINILQKLKKLLKEIEEYDTHKKPQVATLVQSRDMIKILMKILQAIIDEKRYN